MKLCGPEDRATGGHGATNQEGDFLKVPGDCRGVILNFWSRRGNVWGNEPIQHWEADRWQEMLVASQLVRARNTMPPKRRHNLGSH